MTTENKPATRLYAYWRSTRNFTLCLTALWLLATFCVIFFARDLHRITLFGWPLSFYMAAQGILLIYVFIVGIYAWHMRRQDRDFRNHE